MMAANLAVATRLRLDCSENHMQTASVLAEKALADPAQGKLFQVICWDLGQLRKCFHEDHLMVLVVFSKKEHNKRLEVSDDLYYKTMAVAETLAEAREKQEKATLLSEGGSGPRVTLPVRNCLHTSCTSKIEKLSDLKLSFQREPLSLKQYLPLTDENYRVAWSLLQKHYNNKCLMVSHQIKALASAPQVSVESWDPLLLHLHEGKLNISLQREWKLILTSPSTLPSLEEFIAS
ncbi:hypothetical protein PR048_001020 [Dryococelus australis]|uniref:Uncharacterized protein n=1 Tax=Dryococelus australis TaxID=614101 RepID=A0ABQ9IG73_9NEOP|nr:hypothetical protein PR048_001020 [Dryococelus australis]